MYNRLLQLPCGPPQVSAAVLDAAPPLLGTPSPFRAGAIHAEAGAAQSGVSPLVAPRYSMSSPLSVQDAAKLQHAQDTD